MTRSRSSSRRSAATAASADGFWTRTWPGHSTGSTTITFFGSLGTFPARGMVRAWLKAGVIESGEFTPTEEGTPQGGVISPTLLNVALHGMEHAAGVRYRPGARSDAETVKGCPVLVRYADDCVPRTLLEVAM